MQKLYYRPQKISSTALVVLAFASVAVAASLRYAPTQIPLIKNLIAYSGGMPDVEDRMLDASYTAAAAFESIHCHRVTMGHKLLDAHDPADTGMLGPSMSLVTTLPGHLDAKQTSVNPNFAAVATRLLVDAGVRPGDRIAIGCTGSFPALNIAVYSAAKAMDLRPVIISSAASSQFGANSPDLMWPDMEKLLVEEGILVHRSEMVSRGGFRDRAAGMTDNTRAILEASIHRSGLPLLDSQDDLDAIEQRMLIYSQVAADDTYAAYANVGGGDASVGGTVGNDALGEGVIRPSRLAHIYRRVDDPAKVDCVATRFLASGVPVVNLIHSVKLAKRYGLPIAPSRRAIVGEGNVYHLADPRRVFALLGIGLIMLATRLVVKPPHRWMLAYRRWGWFGPEPASQPQLMV